MKGSSLWFLEICYMRYTCAAAGFVCLELVDGVDGISTTSSSCLSVETAKSTLASFRMLWLHAVPTTPIKAGFLILDAADLTLPGVNFNVFVAVLVFFQGILLLRLSVSQVTGNWPC